MLTDKELLEIRGDIIPTVTGGNGNARALALLGDKLLDLIFYEKLFEDGFTDEGAMSLRRNILVSNANMASCAHTFLVPTILTHPDYSKLNEHQKATMLEAVIGATYVKEFNSVSAKTRDLIMYILGLLQNNLNEQTPIWLQDFPGAAITGKTAKVVLKGFFDSCGIKESAYDFVTDQLLNSGFQTSFVPCKYEFALTGLPIKRPIQGDILPSIEEAEEDAASKALDSLRINLKNVLEHDPHWIRKYLPNVTFPPSKMKEGDAQSTTNVYTSLKINQNPSDLNPPTLDTGNVVTDENSTHILSTSSINNNNNINNNITTKSNNIKNKVPSKYKSKLNVVFQSKNITKYFNSCFTTGTYISGFQCEFTPPVEVCLALGLSNDNKYISTYHKNKKNAEDEISKYVITFLENNDIIKKTEDIDNTSNIEVPTNGKRARNTLDENTNGNVTESSSPTVNPHFPIKRAKVMLNDLFLKKSINKHFGASITTEKVKEGYVSTFTPTDDVVESLGLKIDTAIVSNVKTLKKEAEDELSDMVLNILQMKQSQSQHTASSSNISHINVSHDSNNNKNDNNDIDNDNDSVVAVSWTVDKYDPFNVISENESAAAAGVPPSTASSPSPSCLPTVCSSIWDARSIPMAGGCSTDNNNSNSNSKTNPIKKKKQKTILHELFQSKSLTNEFSQCFVTERLPGAAFQTTFIATNCVTAIFETLQKPVVGIVKASKKEAEEYVAEAVNRVLGLVE